MNHVSEADPWSDEPHRHDEEAHAMSELLAESELGNPEAHLELSLMLGDPEAAAYHLHRAAIEFSYPPAIFQLALRCIGAKDYASAYEHARRALGLGEVRAGFVPAYLCFEGLLPALPREDAILLGRDAADAGFALANGIVAELLLLDREVGDNERLALAFAFAGNEAGEAISSTILAEYFTHGWIVEIDHERARLLLLRAAHSGFQLAIERLLERCNDPADQEEEEFARMHLPLLLELSQAN